MEIWMGSEKMAIPSDINPKHFLKNIATFVNYASYDHVTYRNFIKVILI
jgi:hypothetical protein